MMRNIRIFWHLSKIFSKMKLIGRKDQLIDSLQIDVIFLLFIELNIIEA
jgi:hypothetical protein